MKDNRLVRIALFLFFVAVSLIYAVFVQVRGEDVRKDIISIMQQYGIVASDLTPVVENASGTVLSGEDTTGIMALDNDLLMEDQDSFLQELLGTGKTQILSGTKLYYGGLDILQTLGIHYEYILKDTKYDTFYTYIGSGKTYNLQEIVSAVGGKTVDIYARNDIINNLYFGERVTFVQMPQALSTITNLFVRMGDDLWFIQDVSGQYKKIKKHIRNIFTGK